MFNRGWKFLALSLGLCLVHGAAQAQDFLSKPVRIVVPQTPGGASDALARIVGQKLSEKWGQAVVIENRAGAGGSIGTDLVAKSAPDGYTLLLVSPGHAVAPTLNKGVTWDPVRDFRAIQGLGVIPNAIVVHPDVPAKNFQEFVAYVKKNPGKLNYGSASNGSAGHLAVEYLKMASETFMLHVPYRGTGPQLTDLLAGRLDLASVGAPAVLQFIKTGRLRCIATGTTQRLSQLPDVPTVAEQGYPGFEMTQWYGILAPASLPQAAADKLAAAAAASMKLAGTAEKLSAEAAIGVGGTPADFAKFIATEQQRWKLVVARAKIKPD